MELSTGEGVETSTDVTDIVPSAVDIMQNDGVIEP
jgi:hypothetical protein